MNIATVIGNGPSRLAIDLHEINALMDIYGCNALYRDIVPDYLISMDFNMVDEILKSNIHHMCKFYTQHSNKLDELAIKGEPINFVTITRETIDSGNSALRLAAKNNRYDVIYMLGFDYSQSPSVLPNVYAGTSNYARSNNYPAADMRDNQWIQRLRSTIRNYPNQQIVRVNGTKSLNITEPNYSEITIEQYKEVINARIFV